MQWLRRLMVLLVLLPMATAGPHAQAADDPSMQSILEMISNSHCNADMYPPHLTQAPPFYRVSCVIAIDHDFTITFREFATPELAADAFLALAESVDPINTDDFHGLRLVSYAVDLPQVSGEYARHITWLTGRWLVDVYTFDRNFYQPTWAYAETAYVASVRYGLLELVTNPLEQVFQELAPAYCASSPPIFDLSAPKSQFTCAPQPNATLTVGAEEYPDLTAAQIALANPPLVTPHAAQADLLYRWRAERWVFWVRGDQAGWSEAQLDAVRAHYENLLAASGLLQSPAAEEYTTLALLAPDLCASAIQFDLTQPRYALTCVQPNGLPLQLALNRDPQTSAAYALFHYRRQATALQPFQGLPSFERTQTVPGGTEQVFSWVMGFWNIELVTEPTDAVAPLAATVFAGIQRSTLMPPLALAVVTGGLAQCALDAAPAFWFYEASFEPYYAVECMLDAGVELEVTITRYASPALAYAQLYVNTEFHGLPASAYGGSYPPEGHYWETLNWASGVLVIRVSLSSPVQTNLLLPAAETMYETLDRSGLLRLQGMYFPLIKR